ncbi:MAG: hypothetical protein AAFV96_15525 [Pseudomonadota bacterium]
MNASPTITGRFSFRAASPVIVGEAFTTHATARGAGLDLWVTAGEGASARLAMTAELDWSRTATPA